MKLDKRRRSENRTNYKKRLTLLKGVELNRWDSSSLGTYRKGYERIAESEAYKKAMLDAREKQVLDAAKKLNEEKLEKFTVGEMVDVKTLPIETQEQIIGKPLTELINDKRTISNQSDQV